MKLKEVIAQELEKRKDKNSKITKEDFDKLVDLFEEGYRAEMDHTGDSLTKVIRNIKKGDLCEMADSLDRAGEILFDILSGYYSYEDLDEDELELIKN